MTSKRHAVFQITMPNEADVDGLNNGRTRKLNIT